MRKLLFVLIVVLPFMRIAAQVTKRTLPKEWENLIYGAKFMDRFEPMPDGKTGVGIWGTQAVQNRFVDNGIEDNTMSYWGGNIIKGNDGNYHLFVCGWPENSPKGHMSWYDSMTYHAVGDNKNGPFVIRDTIGPGHNTEAFVLKDGRIVVYVIDGCYIADDINGKWKRSELVFDPRNRKIQANMSNLVFAMRQDGSFLMVCRGGSVWISRDGLSPYKQVLDKRIYPAVEAKFEDPVLWRDNIQYHLIVNDWLGRIAYYLRSLDGVNWIVEPGEAYVPGIAKHKDGTVEDWFKLERMKVYQDSIGRAVQANFAVIDTLKWEDLSNDNHSSKNICIPLNKGIVMSVLNKEPINAETKTIDVLVQSEPRFNAQKDLDLKSLRFGAYTKVNYGKGCKVKSTRKNGDDLIITFDGNGSGIDSKEFAPKLIGKTKKGKLVYGYAYLPYINYKPAIVSAAYVMLNTERNTIDFEVENLGLSSSETITVKIMAGKEIAAEGTIKPLKPYESIEMSLPYLGPDNLTKNKKWIINYYKDNEIFKQENIDSGLSHMISFYEMLRHRQKNKKNK